MKIARFRLKDTVQYGIVEGDDVYSLTLTGDVFGDFRQGSRLCQLGDVRLLAPTQPTTVMGVGRNYPGRAKELEVAPKPMIFFKPVTAVVGPLDNIVYPRLSTDVWYEGEVALVIGRRARGITEAAAPDYILGYTCGNDMEANDIKKLDGWSTRAKAFDTFCPIGPVIATGLDDRDLSIKSWVNGVPRQDGSTGGMMWDMAKIVSYFSQFMTLLPGDVILTGCPPGPCAVNVGDTIEIEIEGIGRLANSIVASD